MRGYIPVADQQSVIRSLPRPIHYPCSLAISACLANFVPLNNILGLSHLLLLMFPTPSDLLPRFERILLRVRIVAAYREA